MINQLKTADKLTKKDKQYYDRPAICQVLAYNKQYRQENPDKYGYNSDIIAYINEKEHIPAELQDQLGTEVYLSQHDIENEKLAEYTSEMVAKGYLPLTEEICQKAIDEKKRLEVVANFQTGWLTTKADNIYKPVYAEHIDAILLMKPRARTRGVRLSNFENAFAKLTK